MERRKRAIDSHERVAKKTVEYFRNRNKCSVYKINQNVLIRYGGKGKKASKTQHVCIAKVEKVVNMILTKLILETYLIIKRFPVGSL